MKRLILVLSILALVSCGMGGEQLNDEQSYMATQAMLDMSIAKENATSKIVAKEIQSLLDLTKDCKTDEELANVYAKFVEKDGVTIKGETGDAILNVSVSGDADSSNLSANFKVNFSIDFNDFGYSGSYKEKDSIIAKKTQVTLNGKYKFSFKAYASTNTLSAGTDIIFSGSNVGCKIVVGSETIVDTGIYCYFRFTASAGLTDGANAKVVARVNGKDLTKEATYESILKADFLTK